MIRAASRRRAGVGRMMAMEMAVEAWPNGAATQRRLAAGSKRSSK
jgi:hypothetical protein